jgi:predicted HAD superfamily Cof-like phosphohydrolase
MAAEFIRTYEVEKSVELNLQAVNEELLEFEQALENLLKEGVDVLYSSFVLEQCRPKPGQVDSDTIVQIRRAADILYRMFGQARYEEAYARVHASNMSKLGADGRPVRKPNGCVAKGPNYVPPTLHDLVT